MDFTHGSRLKLLFQFLDVANREVILEYHTLLGNNWVTP